ncbi:class I adenylate-forming enzyme family protein [Aurantivibrio infirmus]
MNYVPLPRLLHDGLSLSTLKLPTKVAAVVEGHSYTYQELDSASDKVGQWLIENSVVRGDRIAVYMDNTWPCIVGIFAILKVGAVFVVVNPQTKYEKLRYVLDDCEAKAMLTDSHLGNVIGDALKVPSEYLKAVLFSGEKSLPLEETNGLVISRFEAVLDSHCDIHVQCPAVANDLAALIYTSGSTGNPKGVMQTHQSMIFALNSILEYLRLDENDRILNVLPLAFDYGLYQLLMSVWLGATLVLERSFTYPAQILNRIDEQKVTVFPGVPTIYSMLMAQYARNKFSIDSVTRVTNTAAALPKLWLEDLKKIFPNALIFKMYGLTECKRTCYLEPELLETHGDSVGKAIPGTEVYLRSPDGQRLGKGSEGILHVRGPHLMLGYWKQQEKTAEMLVPGEIAGQFDLCTHDWFRMDEEGFLYFLARTDDIIKSRGEKVSPLEVEKVLLGIDGVREAAVIGVPDPILGQAIKAYISLDESKRESFKEGYYKKVCMSQLENYMVPKFITPIDQMPKSQNGKIDKKVLLAMESL